MVTKSYRTEYDPRSRMLCLRPCGNYLPLFYRFVTSQKAVTASTENVKILCCSFLFFFWLHAEAGESRSKHATLYLCIEAWRRKQEKRQTTFQLSKEQHIIRWRSSEEDKKESHGGGKCKHHDAAYDSRRDFSALDSRGGNFQLEAALLNFPCVVGRGR